MLENYKEELQNIFAKMVEKNGDKRTAQQIADILINDHQYTKDEYIGGIELYDFRIIHIPNESGLVLPGRANAIEEYFRGNKYQLLIQRLLITEKKAKKVLKILKKRGFRISP